MVHAVAAVDLTSKISFVLLLIILCVAMIKAHFYIRYKKNSSMHTIYTYVSYDYYNSLVHEVMKSEVIVGRV